MPDIPEWMGPIPTLSDHIGNDSYIVISPEGTRSPFVAHFDSKGTVRTFNPNLGVNFPPFSVGDAVVIGEVLESIPYAYDIFFDGSENFGPVQRILLLKKMGFLILEHYFDATQGFPSTYYSLGRRAYVNVAQVNVAKLSGSMSHGDDEWVIPYIPPIQPYTSPKGNIFYEDYLKRVSGGLLVPLDNTVPSPLSEPPEGFGLFNLPKSKISGHKHHVKDAKFVAVPSDGDFYKNHIKGQKANFFIDELSSYVNRDSTVMAGNALIPFSSREGKEKK